MDRRTTSAQCIRKCLLWLGALVMLALMPAMAAANWVQCRICNASLGLGQAEARLELFGRAMNGNIPADQRRDIQINLSNAAAEIAAAEALMSGPIALDRAAKNVSQRLIERISRYPRATEGWSYRRQASYVKHIFDAFRQGLEVTYVSSRPDALRYSANCDVFVALACYHFARASIASAIRGNFYRTYQTGENFEFRHAVNNGIELAMDGGDGTPDWHTPPDGHTDKICCTMGTPFEWREMELHLFQAWSPLEFYAEKERILRRIIRDAALLDPVCKGPKSIWTTSTELEHDGRHQKECGRIAGRWHWSTGNKSDFFEGGRWQTVSDPNDKGSWKCNPDGSIEVVPEAGGWSAKVTVRGDEASGRTSNGAAVTGTRVAGGGSGEPESCTSPGTRIEYNWDAYDPYPGMVPICISESGRYVQAGRTMLRVTGMVRGARTDDGCYHNSRVTTEAGEHVGVLCPPP